MYSVVLVPRKATIDDGNDTDEESKKSRMVMTFSFIVIALPLTSWIIYIWSERESCFYCLNCSLRWPILAAVAVEEAVAEEEAAGVVEPPRGRLHTMKLNHLSRPHLCNHLTRTLPIKEQF